jgi:23S rRNA pseudouridine1911/1915/1917 synthase
VRRCDQLLVEALAAAGHEISRSRLAAAFADGHVTADGVAVRASRKIDAPLVIDVRIPVPAPPSAKPQAIPLTILYEDDDVLVVDKAPGMVVHPASGHPDGTLVNAVLHHLGVGATALPVLPGNDATRPGIVHRLDRDTSGVLVVAKHVTAQTRLAEQFATHALDRRYVAVLAGDPAWTQRRVETGHGRDPHDRRRFAPLPRAERRAISEFSITERLHEACVAEVRLHTGRTHQIRMHARHLGHPVLADPTYGFGRPSRDPIVRAAVEALGRQALHAAVLGIRHPADGREMRWTSPVPEDMQRLIDALR